MAREPDSWRAIDGVTGLDRPFPLDVIVRDDRVDACVVKRRTMITRNRKLAVTGPRGGI